MKNYTVIGLILIIGSIQLVANQAPSDLEPTDLLRKFEILSHSKSILDNASTNAALLKKFSSHIQALIARGTSIIENEDPEILKTKFFEFKNYIQNNTNILLNELKQLIIKEKNEIEILKNYILEWDKKIIGEIDSTKDKTLINKSIKILEENFDSKYMISDIYANYIKSEESLEYFMNHVMLVIHDIEIKIAKNKKDLPIDHYIL